MINLGPRLKEIAKSIPQNAALIDVGCDHGLLPVSLLLGGHIRHAVAVDINAAPLDKAKRLAREHSIPPHLFEAIHSDGLSPFFILTQKNIVIAGMGRTYRINTSSSPSFNG